MSRLLTVLLFCLLSYDVSTAQSKAHHLYLLGNSYQLSTPGPTLSAIDSLIRQQGIQSHILYLGDLVGEVGIDKQASEQHIRQLDNMTTKFRAHPYAELLFFGGDRDWDGSGKKGDKKIKWLEDYIEKELNFKKSFNPSNGCPGPKSLKINAFTTLIAINSQWLLHPHDRPAAPDTDCKIITEADFWEELEEAVEEAEGQNIIIAAHHPVASNGRYAGKKMYRYHFIPIYGTLYSSYHRQIGSPADMAYEKYQHYSHRMRSLLHDHSSILFISGHEHDLQILKEGRNYFVNSGSLSHPKPVARGTNTVFRRSSRGFIRLDYQDDGRVDARVFKLSGSRLKLYKSIPLLSSACESKPQEAPSNTAYNPCARQGKQLSQMNPAFRDSSATAIAGAEYVNTPFRRWAMGTHYRKEWLTPIATPFLDLDQQFGGLRPFAKGGGLQTHSLKFKAADGNEYAFRSINKDPVKALDELSRQTIYRHIVKDLITTQHPYGGLVAARLMDETDILHADPLLYIMPDDAKLGIYQKEFANKLGTLELRPKKPKKGKSALGGATGITSSNKMFRAFYKNNFHRIDAQNYARARVFDMLLGDWDRHEDNWKWAAFKEGKHTSYRPIPRDRDHVFSQWEGLIPSLADKVVPNAEHFGRKFDNIQHLNFKARHLDRQLGSELSKEDWLEATRYIQQRMTDGLIAQAIATLPDEVELISGPEIQAKLISRRLELEQAATSLYELLAKEVDVVGSNKREVFEVERRSGGQMMVRMYDRDKDTGEPGQLLYERLFNEAETNEVRLFGLGGKDDFKVSGKTEEAGILLRIIGGSGADSIEDGSSAKGSRRLTQVYDSRRKDHIQAGAETKILRPARQAHYNNKAFEYSFFSPLPKFRISSGNGFGLEVLGTYYKRGFNKPDFARKHQLKLIYYPGLKANRADWKSRFTEVVGWSDLELHLRYSNLYDKFPFFYGLGNKTVRDEQLVDEDYYRTDFRIVQLNVMLDRKFWQKSHYSYGLRFEYSDVSAFKEDFSIFDQHAYSRLNGLGKKFLAGIHQQLDFDFRDHPQFSTQGSQLLFDHTLLSDFDNDNALLGKVEAFLAHYETAKIGVPLTLALRAGGSATYGHLPFYYLSALGSNAYLRAHVRNRFLGEHAVFFNTELRVHVGNIRTPLFPIKWGMLGFWDAGRVWLEDEQNAGGLHYGYGGGLYAAPFNKNFNLIFILGESLDKNLYFTVSTGFDLQ